jgi:CRP-like cAMP-binding protein
MSKPLLMTRLSTRNLYELQVKSANYEAMMQRFQLRKVSNCVVGDETPNPAVLEAVGVNKGMPRYLSVREVLLWLTRRRTWRHAWKFATAPITPGGWVSTFHGLSVFGLNHFELFYLPFSFTFHPSGSRGTAHTGLVLQALHLADLVLNLNTAVVRQRELETRTTKIAREHVTKWFVLELLSALPVDLVYVVSSGSPVHMCGVLLRYDAVLMALRMFRLLFVKQSLLPTRLLQHKHLMAWLLYSRYSHLLGIAKLIWLVLLVTHFMACMWHTIARHQGGKRVGEQYIAAVYYAVQLIQGQGGATDSWEEHLFSTCVILIGSVILAIVFGEVALLVSNFNANTTSYRQKMEGVVAVMDKMNLPLKLQERVHQYYTHVWTEYRSLDGDIVKFQRELAHTLGIEVGLYKYMNLVMRIPFWESCSPDFATQIILNLAVRVYLPDDYVVRKGETGDEMFMINRGICELSDPENQQPGVAILSSDGSSSAAAPEKSEGSSASSENDTASEETDAFRDVPVPFSAASRPFFRHLSGEKPAQVIPHKSTYEIDPDDTRFKLPDAKNQILLYPGQAFGEMSLLMNYKRTANIRAVTYVEICVFDRKRFQRIISRYPEDRRLVLKMMLRSCIEKKEIPFPWDEVVDAVAAKRRQTGSSLVDIQATITSTEAAQALVDRIDVNRPDESIKYGFQTFHPDLKPVPSEESTVTSRVGSNPHLRRPAPEPSPKRTSEAVRGETLSAVTTQIQGLEKSLAEMMRVVSSMATSIERLEKRTERYESCNCRPSRCASLDEDEQHVGSLTAADEARRPDYARALRSKRKLRRPSSTPNVFREALKPKAASPDEPVANTQLLVGIRQLGSPGPTQTAGSQDDLGPIFVSKKLGAAVVDAGLDGTLRGGSRNADVGSRQKHAGPKHKSPTKESTIIDRLWRQQTGKRVRRSADGGGEAAQPSLVRTRSSLPPSMVIETAKETPLTAAKLHSGPLPVAKPRLARTRSNLPPNVEEQPHALTMTEGRHPSVSSIGAKPQLLRTRSNVPSTLEIPKAVLLEARSKLPASADADHSISKRRGSRVGIDALKAPPPGGEIRIRDIEDQVSQADEST